MMKTSILKTTKLEHIDCISPGKKSACGIQVPKIRSPSKIMTLSRLGSSFPSRLSFMRILIRRLIQERPKLKILSKDLDQLGHGTMVLSLSIANKPYSLIGYTQALNPDERTDRVIATKWDASFCLFNGVPSENQIRTLEKQVTTQEAGRFDANVLTLSRANKSVRLFNHVLEQLASGQQPHSRKLLKTGYLMRTTAVYGNGKFGIADRGIILNQPGLEGPFQVEMLTVFLIREFTFLLVEHCAKKLGTGKEVKLANNLKRFLGIGNSTGLGMAPFLVNHPCLLHSWVMAKEIALGRSLSLKTITKEQKKRLFKLIERAKKHIIEWEVEDLIQMDRIMKIREELVILECKIKASDLTIPFPLQYFFDQTENLSNETQELIVSILIELIPEQVDGLVPCLANPYDPKLIPEMSLSALKNILDTEYEWVSKIILKKGKSDSLFWYTSQEKLEPRIGKRYEEPGSELEMPFNIRKYVNELDQALIKYDKPEESVAEFLLNHPNLRHIIRRVQNTKRYPYSEIRDNLVDENSRPIDLLRFKLAFFGASKFDPKSDRWTRITLFQGAPISSDISTTAQKSKTSLDDWIFATLPS